MRRDGSPLLLLASEWVLTRRRGYEEMVKMILTEVFALSFTNIVRGRMRVQ